MAERQLLVRILGDASSLERAFGKSTKATHSFSSSVTASVASLVKGAVVVGATQKAFEALGVSIRAGISEFSEQQKVAAQTAAVLASTGGIAGVTADHVASLASELSKLSGVDDEVVASGENLLLTFTKIRNQVGKGNDIFDQATKATEDLSVAFHKDLNSSAILVGKALNDPIKGITALRRVGVSFTEAQQKQIKALVESGHALQAQKIILAELRTETGGAAKALGDTLPGQIDKLRNRFRELAGRGIGAVAPAFGKAVRGVNVFIDAIGKAHGASAKFSVAKDLIVKAFDSLDLGGLKDKIIGKLQAAFAGINFGEVGRTIGDALKHTLSRIDDFISGVDWQNVGRALIRGMAIAIAALAKFIAGVDWKALVGAMLRHIVTTIKAFTGILVGAGKELGGALVRGLSDGLKALGGFLEKQALRIVLKVAEALNISIPHFGHIVPGLNSLVKAIKGKLAEIDAASANTAAGLAGIGKAAKKAAGDAASAPDLRVSSALKSPLDESLGLSAGVDPKKVEKAAENRNKFFDAAIGRAVNRVQDITNLQGQLDALAKIAALITKRLARTKDVTRRLKLEDDLLGVVRQEKAVREQIADAFSDALDFKLTKAETTHTLADDVKRLQEINANLAKRIKAETDINKKLSLEQKLFQSQQDLKQKLIDQRSRAQFHGLGLGDTGDKVIPSVTNLLKQTATLTKRLAGTSINTTGVQKQIQQIEKVLSGAYGKVTATVRAKIQELLDTIREPFKGKGPLTSTTSLAAAAGQIFEGLGLSRAQQKELSARFSGFNSAGLALSGGGTVPAPQFGGPQVQPIVINNTVELDGHVVAKSTNKVNAKRNARNAHGRRGR